MNIILLNINRYKIQGRVLIKSNKHYELNVIKKNYKKLLEFDMYFCVSK